MFKIVIIIFSLFATLYSSENSIIEAKNINKINSNKIQKTYIDNFGILSIDEIVQIKEFKKIKKSNFKAKKNQKIWINFKIKNNQNHNIELFFTNDKPALDIIDVYIFENNKAFRKIKLGDRRDKTLRKIEIRKSAFVLNLKKQAIYEFYIMHSGYSSISTAWSIENQKSFTHQQLLESTVWGFFIGIISILILYNLITYFAIKQKAFLIYSFMALSIAIYQLCVSGVFYQYLAEEESIEFLHNLNWPIGFLAQSFILLFAISFFKPKKSSFIYKLLFVLYILNICTVILYSYSYFNQELKYLTKYTDMIIFTTIPSLILVSIWAVKNRLDGSIFYLLGQVSYLCLIFYGVFVTIGYFEPMKNIWIIVPFGIILDVIFLSLALQIKIKAIKQEALEKEQLLISQARFYNLGQTITKVVKQLKEPISRVNSQLLLLKFSSLLTKERLKEDIEQTLFRIEEELNTINMNINDIYNFYSNPTSKQNFSIKSEIELITRLLNTKLKELNINISFSIQDIVINNYKSYFINIVSAILEYTIYELKKLQKTRRIVYISSKTKNQNIVICLRFKIKKQIDIKKLFTINKKYENHHVALAIAKRTIQIKMKGKLETRSNKDELIFEIILPKH